MTYDEFVEYCDEVLTDIERLPPRAASFTESVQEKVESMQLCAEENEHVTPKMIASVERMHDGVLRWLV